MQWILKFNGEVVPRRTLRPLTTQEIHSDDERKKREEFTKRIELKLGSAMFKPKQESVKSEFIEYEDEVEKPRIIPEIEQLIDSNGKPLNQ